jgi:hypothetical protein
MAVLLLRYFFVKITLGYSIRILAPFVQPRDAKRAVPLAARQAFSPVPQVAPTRGMEGEK